MRTLTALVLGGVLVMTGQAYAGSDASGGVEKRSTDMTGGKSGLPEHYDVQAVSRGQLKDASGAMLDHQVINPQGEKLGTIEKLIKDTKTGKIEYAVMELPESKYQLPLQWSLFKQQGDKLVLKATKDDLRPDVNSTLTKDNSPEVSQYMKQINSVRQNPTGGEKGIGITDQPAGAGSMGEDKAGGGGPAGTRALPPGQAPGFEGGNPSSKR